MKIGSPDSDSATSKCNSGLRNEAVSQNLKKIEIFREFSVPGMFPCSGIFLEHVFSYQKNPDSNFEWCEALSAFGPKCKKRPAKMSGKNFDLNHQVLIIFIPLLNLTPRLLRDNTGAPTQS